MKNRTAMLLAGIMISAAVLSGCGSSEATKAVKESTETEREGSGEAVEEEKELNEEENTDSKVTEPKEEPEVTKKPETAEEAKVTEQPEEEEAPEQETVKKVIGILLPSEEGAFRWERDGETMSSYLTEAGYDPQIRYANEDSDTQISQIEEMILTEAEAMII